MSVRRRTWPFFLFVAPWLVGLLLFQVGPMLGALGLTFVEWRYVGAPRWVGLENYRAVLADPLFGKTLLNTLLFTLGSVPLGLAASLGLAYLLNNHVRGAALLRMIFFLPVVVSGVAVSLLWAWLFNAQHGLINQLLALVGIRGPAWLQDPRWAMGAVILMSLWSIGGNIVLYLAALQRLPRDLHEAAALDGATAWQRFRHITLPLLSPVTLFLTVVGVMNAFQLFTPTYILTRGGPNHATLTTALYIYFNAFQWQNLGQAAVMAWLLCLLILALTAAQFSLSRRWVFYEL